jgi:hypothetical protein
LEKIDLRKSGQLMYEAFLETEKFVLDTESFILKNGERVTLEVPMYRQPTFSCSVFTDKKYNRFLVFNSFQNCAFFRVVMFIKDEDLDGLYIRHLKSFRLKVSTFASIEEMQQEQYCSCVKGFSNYIQAIPVSGYYFNKKEIKKEYSSIKSFLMYKWYQDIGFSSNTKKEDIINIINYNSIISVAKISMKYWERKNSKYPTKSPLLDDKLGGLGLILQKILKSSRLT